MCFTLKNNTIAKKTKKKYNTFVVLTNVNYKHIKFILKRGNQLQNYVFITDSDSDLPYNIVDERKIEMIYMSYNINGEEFFDDLGRNQAHKKYYDDMRAGSVPRTTALPSNYFVEYFSTFLKEGKDILYLAFSSQLSANIFNVFMAKEELLAKYPDRKIIVVDTLSISYPQAILVIMAHDLYKEGKSIEEVANWVEENKLRSQAWFTVDDLKYLQRGGRISAVSAVVGSLLNIKPIITESKEGKIVSIDKIKGRKKSLHYIAQKVADNLDENVDPHLTIIHADALDDANMLAEKIKELVPNIEKIEFSFIGSVIGAHCGPGTVAACFFGKKRAN